jgi:hypothetical protein
VDPLDWLCLAANRRREDEQSRADRRGTQEATVQFWTDISIAAALQVPVHPVEFIPRDRRLCNMIAEGTKDFSPVYSAWFGKPVVILVVIRQCHVPMPCRIVGESAADVRVRIQPGWEMEVRKDLILAVEEIVFAAEDQVN